MGNWGHREPEESPSRGKRPNCRKRMVARAKKLLSPGDTSRAPTATGSGPRSLSREEVREADPLPSPHPTPDPRSRPSWAALAQPGPGARQAGKEEE